MKRTLIAAALATLAAGSAFAQSSVTIYGRFNVTGEAIERGNTDTVYELVNNASRIGFKGIEDLGGGLKAGFVLEHGFSVDTGTPSGAFWGRQSEVFLSSNAGTIRLGNFTSEAYYATADYISLHNHDTGNSEDKLYAYLGRNTNKVSYRTPEFIAGLTAEAAVYAGESANETNPTPPPATRKSLRGYDGAINYVAGPVQLGLGYERARESEQLAVRALVELGSFIIGGYVQRHDDEVLGDRMIYRLSAALNAGAAEFHINYGHAEEYERLAGSDADQGTVGINYNLSKRTKVYTYYTQVKDDKQISGTGGDFKSFALGVRHNF